MQEIKLDEKRVLIQPPAPEPVIVNIDDLKAELESKQQLATAYENELNRFLTDPEGNVMRTRNSLEATQAFVTELQEKIAKYESAPVTEDESLKEQYLV